MLAMSFYGGVFGCMPVSLLARATREIFLVLCAASCSVAAWSLLFPLCLHQAGFTRFCCAAVLSLQLPGFLEDNMRAASTAG